MRKNLWLTVGLILATLVASLFFPHRTDAQGSSLWKYTGTLNPVVSTWTLTIPQLANCSSLRTNGLGLLSCGSGGFGTGSVITIGDSRYVNISGDTMTGALNIQVSGGTNSTVSLETPHTLSGRILHAQDRLRSSGTTVLDGNTTINGAVAVNTTSGYPLLIDAGAQTNVHGVYVYNAGAGTTGFAYVLAGGGGFSIDNVNSSFAQTTTNRTMAYAVVNEAFDASPQAYLFTQAIGSVQRTLMALRGYAAQTANILEWQNSVGTVLSSVNESGYLGINRTGEASVPLEVNGIMSGTTLVVSNTVSSNLTPTTSNTYDLGTSALRWRHLYLSGGSLNVGSSSQFGKIGYNYTGSEGLAFYGSGTTTTPSMFVSSGGTVGIGTTTPRAKLDVVGNTIIAGGGTTTLTVRRENTSQFANYTADTAGTAQWTWGLRSDGTNDWFLRDSVNGRSAIRALISSGLVKMSFGASGTTLRADTTLISSGTLLVEGAATLQSTLTIGGLAYTFPASQSAGTYLRTDGAGALTWAAIPSGFGTGQVITTGDARYVKKQGDTMTGNLLVRATISGSTLRVDRLAALSGALAIEGGFWQDGLADCDNAGEKPVYNFATGKWTCGTDDDVPESGDFAAGVDLEADGSLSADVIADAEMADNDFGDWTCATGDCTLDADVVAAAEMADADHGDIAWSGGVAGIDADTVGQSEVTGNALDYAEFQDALDLDASTATALGNFNYTFNMNSAGDVLLNKDSASHIEFNYLGHTILNAGKLSAGDLQVMGDNDSNLLFTDASADGVGIGTPTPGAKLAVSGSLVVGLNIGSRAAKARLDVVGTASASLLTINGSSAAANYIQGNLSVGTAGNAGSAKLNIAGTMSGKGLRVTGSGANPIISTNQATGGVSIGTATGSHLTNTKLIVSGDGYARHPSDQSTDTVASFIDADGVVVSLTTQSTTGYGSLNFGDSAGGNRGGIFYGHSTDLMQLSAGGVGILNVLSTGMGVGTGTPQMRMQVTGGGLCVGSDANCNTDNNTEGVVYSSAVDMTLYDVAERYPTKDLTLTGAELLSLDVNNPVFVKRAVKGDKRLIGILSLDPALDLGGFHTEQTQFKDQHQVAVALVGRVPLQVSTENGSVEIGDDITISSVPGVGMRASKGDQSVGYALDNCVKPSWWNLKPKTCVIQVFVRSTN